MPTLTFAGHNFRVVDGTALYWPTRNAIIVADLHLEKASWFASRGQMLPPHDSLATLERLLATLEINGAVQVWCLGDNFHDDSGPARMTDEARALLRHLTDQFDWRWIMGNHDAQLQKDVGGTIVEEEEVDGLVLRHRADPRERRHELSGHFHPKFRARAKSRNVARPCFVQSRSKLILPAFGAFTGGLNADHAEIRAVVGAGAQAVVASGMRTLHFSLP
jgi:uncharacterized protein